MNRAMVHEAGHAIIATQLGFEIIRIAVNVRMPQLQIANFDSPERTPAERYLVLVGGIASESLVLHGYDQQAMGADQKLIQERGGAQIDKYLPDGMKILTANQDRLDLLIEKLHLRWITARAEAQFTSDPDSFELLSGKEVEEIWSESSGHPG